MTHTVVNNTNGTPTAARWWAGNKIVYPVGVSKVPTGQWIAMRNNHGIPAGISKTGVTDEDGSEVDVTYV